MDLDNLVDRTVAEILEHRGLSEESLEAGLDAHYLLFAVMTEEGGRVAAWLSWAMRRPARIHGTMQRARPAHAPAHSPSRTCPSPSPPTSRDPSSS